MLLNLAEKFHFWQLAKICRLKLGSLESSDSVWLANSEPFGSIGLGHGSLLAARSIVRKKVRKKHRLLFIELARIQVPVTIGHGLLFELLYHYQVRKQSYLGLCQIWPIPYVGPGMSMDLNYQANRSARLKNLGVGPFSTPLHQSSGTGFGPVESRPRYRCRRIINRVQVRAVIPMKPDQTRPIYILLLINFLECYELFGHGPIIRTMPLYAQGCLTMVLTLECFGLFLLSLMYFACNMDA